MKLIAMIPARYGATRFPAKLMQDLCGKPVIVHTYQRVADTHLFDQVYVVTDDDRIEKAIREVGGSVIRSQKQHNSGSDRLAEASKNLEVDIIVNVQGDEPFTDKENAENARSILANEKIPAEVFTYRDKNGRTFYRLRVGPYTTESEAQYWNSRIKLIEHFSSTQSYVTNSSKPLR